MKSLLIAITAITVSAAALCGCSRPMPDAAGNSLVSNFSQPGAPLPEFATAEEAMSHDLADPRAAQFRNVHLSEDGQAVCGEINAKNALGAYVGFARFVVFNDGQLKGIVDLQSGDQSNFLAFLRAPEDCLSPTLREARREMRNRQSDPGQTPDNANTEDSGNFSGSGNAVPPNGNTP